MDYVPGRSLGQILHHRGVFSEEEAKFYIAEIIVGLDIIHKAGFVYRDLKVCSKLPNFWKIDIILLC